VLDSLPVTVGVPVGRHQLLWPYSAYVFNGNGDAQERNDEDPIEPVFSSSLVSLPAL
jgi:hypothetical protein